LTEPVARGPGPRRGSLSLGLLHPTFERWGGAEWFIHQTLERLAGHGFSATVYTHRWRPPPGAGRPTYGIVEHRSGGYRSLPWDWRRIARRYHRRWAAHDLLFVHNYPATIWCREARRLGALPPAVWYCHEPPARLHDPCEREAPRPRGRRAALASLLFYRWQVAWRVWSGLRARLVGPPVREDLILIERESVRSFAVVLANSRFTAERIARIYGLQAEVLHPVPADLARLAPERPAAREPLVLWVGRLTAAKRPLLMLEAWRRARSLSPALASFRLLLVGEGPLGERVRREAARDPSVRLESSLARRELVDRYRRALLTVHLGRDEPFGLVPLEAAAAGSAVLAAAEGGVREIVEEGRTGFLLEPVERETLAARLVELLADPGRVEGAGVLAAREIRARFDPERSFERLRELLAAVARGGTATPPAG